MNRENIEQHIRENWFGNHKATYTEHGDLKVLDWREPGTCTYATRYVFDGCKMYISGDIGEAVFWLTWKADVHTFNNTHIGYFVEKLRAYSSDRVDFDTHIAVKRLREWLKELKEDDVEYDNEAMRELFEEARGCTSKSEWDEIVNRHSDFIHDLDCEYWEWMYSIGDEIPYRVHGYLIGLKMASEQLKEVEGAE